MSHVYNSLVILIIVTPNIIMAITDNSNPSYGKNVNNPAPIPKAEANPNPQAAHPGAKAAKKTPMLPKMLNFLSVLTFPRFAL